MILSEGGLENRNPAGTARRVIPLGGGQESHPPGGGVQESHIPGIGGMKSHPPAETATSFIYPGE